VYPTVSSAGPLLQVLGFGHASDLHLYLAPLRPSRLPPHQLSPADVNRLSWYISKARTPVLGGGGSSEQEEDGVGDEEVYLCRYGDTDAALPSTALGLEAMVSHMPVILESLCSPSAGPSATLGGESKEEKTNEEKVSSATEKQV